VPVLWLFLIQTLNLLSNKTTMERYSRTTPSMDDLKDRVINSGIRDDMRIIIDTYS